MAEGPGMPGRVACGAREKEGGLGEGRLLRTLFPFLACLGV